MQKGAECTPFVQGAPVSLTPSSGSSPGPWPSEQRSLHGRAVGVPHPMPSRPAGLGKEHRGCGEPPPGPASFSPTCNAISPASVGAEHEPGHIGRWAGWAGCGAPPQGQPAGCSTPPCPPPRLSPRLSAGMPFKHQRQGGWPWAPPTPTSLFRVLGKHFCLPPQACFLWASRDPNPYRCSSGGGGTAGLPTLPGPSGGQACVPPSPAQPSLPGCPAPASSAGPMGHCAGIRLGLWSAHSWALADGVGEGLSHTPTPPLAWCLSPSQLSWGGGQAGAPTECVGEKDRVSPGFQGSCGPPGWTVQGAAQRGARLGPWSAGAAACGECAGSVGMW